MYEGPQHSRGTACTCLKLAVAAAAAFLLHNCGFLAVLLLLLLLLSHHVQCITRVEGVRQLLLSSLLPAHRTHDAESEGL
jgi:hypothetical protein